MSVIVPCFLPNEKSIIHSTIDHICDNVQYPADVVLHVVYNTPKLLPAEEAKLAALHGTVHGALKRMVIVHKVEGSRSKAENLNHVIGTALDPLESRYVAIFDADHHPDADCLLTLMAFMLQTDADCVQGSTYIRNRSWSDHHGRGGGCGVLGQMLAVLLANVINAEFFVTYFVWMPAIERIGRTGFFGGSVALWRYHSLVNYTFSTELQTEDIECSARAVLAREKIRFCPEARSGELSPANLGSFWRQRVRWATGWDQVSIKYFDAIAASQLSFREKAGLYYVFPGRWIACTIGLVAGIAHPIIALVYAGSPWGPWLNGELLVGALFYAVTTLMIMSQMLYHEKWTSWPFAGPEPALGFTLTRYFSVDRPDSIASGLDSIIPPDVEAPVAASTDPPERAVGSKPPNGNGAYHQML
ncbi:glycosyltransferase like family 2-domain-containing protein [Pavlovales sp. CCMP2436]|nr:glycosyltransferase like family 2-domain-containing protein [Pavlovales sp. CCMP2436]